MTSNTAVKTVVAMSDLSCTVSAVTLAASNDDRMWNSAAMSNSCNMQHKLPIKLYDSVKTLNIYTTIQPTDEL